MEPKMNFYYPEGMDYPDFGDPTDSPKEPTPTTKKVEPRTRKEHYLAKIAGEDVTIPEPKTRQEHYLKKIAENGGSGGGGIFVVTTAFTDFGDEPTYSKANHGASEIFSAIENGQLPVLFETINDEPPSAVLVYAYDIREKTGDVFAAFTRVSGGYILRVADDGTVTVL